MAGGRDWLKVTRGCGGGWCRVIRCIGYNVSLLPSLVVIGVCVVVFSVFSSLLFLLLLSLVY